MTVLIVAGSRTIRDRATVAWAIEDADLIFGPLDEIVHGGAKGVDSLADNIAREKGYATVTVFDAEWREHGRSAGPIRNEEMANYGDALVAVWDGESPGTENMIQTALDAGLDVLVKQV